MAYEKQNWVCGETITAEKLNHIEDGIAECCGGGDAGYECETSYIELLSQTVETTKYDPSDTYALGDFDSPLSAEPQNVVVTFNGTDYTCSYNEEDASYGASWDQVNESDWSEYPFRISAYQIATENAGTYNVKVVGISETITVSDCFAKARGYSCEEVYRAAFNDDIDVHDVADNGYSSDVVTSDITKWSDTIRVTFEGVEYIVESASDAYGAPYDENLYAYDWSEYPFQIMHYGDGNFRLSTENAGTHSVEIEIQVLEATTTECFNAAVRSVPKEFVGVEYASYLENGDEGFYLDIDGEELYDALYDGKEIRVHQHGNPYDTSGVEIMRWGHGGSCGPRQYWFAVPILKNEYSWGDNVGTYEICQFVSTAGVYDNKPIHIITSP